MGTIGPRATLRLALLGLAVSASGMASPPEDGEAVVLDDFRSAEPSPSWTFDGVEGRRVDASGKGALELSGWNIGKDRSAIAALALRERDWRRFDSLSLLVGAAPASLPVQVLVRQGTGKRLFHCAVTLPEGGAGELVLPLREFYDESWGLSASWEGVDSLELWFAKGSGPVRLDGIGLVPGTRGEASCRTSLEAWTSLGFPEGNCRAIPGRNFVLVTDAPAYRGTRGAKLLSKLEEALRILSGRYGVSGELPGPVPVFIFSNAADYRSFFSRMSEKWTGTARDPASPNGTAGFGAVGIPLGSDGSLYEPFLVHEGLHPVVKHFLGLRTTGSWIQEGLACAVENRLHPEYFRDTATHWRKLSRESFQRFLKGDRESLLPLAKLLGPESPPLQEWTELLTVFDYLAERQRGKLPKVWDAVRSLDEEPAKAALPALLGALGMTLEELEADWAKWGATSYK